MAEFGVHHFIDGKDYKENVVVYSNYSKLRRDRQSFFSQNQVGSNCGAEWTLQVYNLKHEDGDTRDNCSFEMALMH